MEVTVTIPDSLYERVDSLACQQDKSHSTLVVQALQHFVDSTDKIVQTGTIRPSWLNWSDEEITHSLNEFAAEHDTTVDPGLASAQTRALHDKWDWD